MSILVLFLLIVIALISYGAGALNTALLLSRFVLQKDLRRHGSGKTGYANFVRVFGPRWGYALIAVDVLKGAIVILLGGLLMQIPAQGFPVIGRMFAGLWLMLGQMYPVQQQFRGGKGVVACMTALWLADWRVGLISTAVFIIVVAFSQYISLAGVAACVAGAPAAWIFVSGDDLKGMAGLLALIMAIVIVWRHRGNLFKIQAGREPKVKWGRQPNRKIKDDDF